ncbi:MAG: type II toxin-antitoxin system VapC family toxin [Novosphingobium sp.]|uniref:type II toxin-antitoxin system VapC family toxin n=1 Tax=Novosphingobium sp. TaxID=1874826 RepID=UPI003B9BBE52
MILVDSNVLIDIIADDPAWADWSLEQVVAASQTQDIAYNDVVVAEIAPGMASLQAFQQEMERITVGYEVFTQQAAYFAGLAFRQYRAVRKGSDTPKLPLPDFLIGGHAQSLGAAILTRDARFYRSYFPTVPLITPE